MMASRESDERILAWLAAHDAGQSYAQIAQRWGVSRGAVASAVGDVRKADRQAHA